MKCRTVPFFPDIIMHVLGKVIQKSARAEDTSSVPIASQAKTVRAAMDEFLSK